MKKILFQRHHLSHAAVHFDPSNFEKAVILTADGIESGQLRRLP